MSEWAAPLSALLVAGLVARLAGGASIGRAPTSLVRTNVDERAVPAVLGIAILAGVAAAVLAYEIWERWLWHLQGDCDGVCPADSSMIPHELAWVTLVPVGGMFAAGLWDDLRGDERPRGFVGHLGALRGGALTGGVVKMVAGLVVSLGTILALWGWTLFGLMGLLLMAAPVALGANLLNLLDRAPGRALKVFVLFSILTLAVSPEWRFFIAGPLGAALGILGLDLKAKGMLGDAGANPLGAIAGLGFVILAVEGARPREGYLGLLVLTIVLLGLNLLSEKVSFSKVIESTPWLARLDHLGRK